MASKTSSSLALSLTLNLLLFVIANSCGTCTGPIPRTPKPGPSPNLPRPPSQNLPRPGPGQNTPRPGPGPNTPQPGPNPNTPQPGPNPNTPQPGPNPNTPQPGPNPNTPPGGGNPNTPPGGGNCPRDALKLGVCADVLGLLNNVTIGAPPRLPCCSLLGNLVNLEAAVCLCTAIRANVLGINLNVPIALSLVLNYCGVGVPPGFQC